MRRLIGFTGSRARERTLGTIRFKATCSLKLLLHYNAIVELQALNLKLHRRRNIAGPEACKAGHGLYITNHFCGLNPRVLKKHACVMPSKPLMTFHHSLQPRPPHASFFCPVQVNLRSARCRY